MIRKLLWFALVCACLACPGCTADEAAPAKAEAAKSGGLLEKAKGLLAGREARAEKDEPEAAQPEAAKAEVEADESEAAQPEAAKAEPAAAKPASKPAAPGGEPGKRSFPVVGFLKDWINNTVDAGLSTPLVLLVVIFVLLIGGLGGWGASVIDPRATQRRRAEGERRRLQARYGGDWERHARLQDLDLAAADPHYWRGVIMMVASFALFYLGLCVFRLVDARGSILIHVIMVVIIVLVNVAIGALVLVFCNWLPYRRRKDKERQRIEQIKSEWLARLGVTAENISPDQRQQWNDFCKSNAELVELLSPMTKEDREYWTSVCWHRLFAWSFEFIWNYVFFGLQKLAFLVKMLVLAVIQHEEEKNKQSASL